MTFTLPDYEYQSQRVTVHKTVHSGQWNTLAEIDGPGIVKHLWVTISTTAKQLSRMCILRIYWDDEAFPSVEAPIGDFFGLPMGMTGSEYQLDSCYLHILPKNGLNCYFTMPFAKKAIIQLYIDPEVPSQDIYFQCDYEKCTDGLPERWAQLRFHAKYRMESPTDSYGHRYVVMDAQGEGYLIGATFGIRAASHQQDSWYHGGGDLILIDGERHPHLMHGIGAEDFFGHSWGTARSSHLYMGNPFCQTLDTDHKSFVNLVLYRFFAQDPIRFKSSITMQLGAMGACISSVAYWYQDEPHREFYKLPGGKDLWQESLARRLSGDVLPEYMHTWNVYGPVKDEDPNPFDKTHEIEKSQDLSLTTDYRVSDNTIMPVSWKTLNAPRGFMDFHVCMRPHVPRINYQTQCYGFAYGYITLREAFEGTIRVGFDDRMRLYVNDRVVLDETHGNGFEVQKVPISLTSGTHKILFKLSNMHNNNFRSWASHLAFFDTAGRFREDMIIQARD
ncbi:hypothetical protein J31TS4_17080 [Paenibacillus sp. J31TS4]|uniref:glycoside hydrolase family 172 protein n=1 Tax=Paenibacillus sp. J31TS4 TaxID=2807195 RepID=UPI001B0B4960|nr:glycoside hydrolase family 172 protein [Paenibacillus sp. J31TS4]GIP38428.1 hypothetical protein J31TS4_17080 [Paenibacillus sp. J31TS4]